MWLVVSILSFGFFAVQAFKTGMPVRRWALAGLVAGPAVWPLFQVHLKRAQKRNWQPNYVRLNA
ncbi:hypothetical protein FCL42_13135 [Ferrimonas aestuarii]|uniref:Uncharacterized protein n=1 Tax=Ferrimonas aestuarii TaxID=2569539 RepID=A0A4U1BMF3_9GAMM|nr:hypothetical protein FCL42_13135 [Ferrimonas aestuarii]